MTPERLRRLWRDLPPFARAALPPALEARLRARARAALDRPDPPGLEARLWGGFSEAALRDLARLAETAAPPVAAEARWITARWHAAHGDYAEALTEIVAMRDTHPPAGRARRQILLEALFLARLGRGTGARTRLDTLPGPRLDVSAALIRATSHGIGHGISHGATIAGSAAPRGDGLLRDGDLSGGAVSAGAAAAAALGDINAVFRRFGLQEIALRDPADPLSLDNIRGADPGPKAGIPKAGTGPTVTVIVPAWQAEATLPTALASLTDQTHGALEILVVDDASTDGTAEVAAEAARADPRIRLIRQPGNRGGYAARNRALGEATGDLVTVHDADDWSHPEKIARQVRALRFGAPSSFTDWVRATPDLAFLGHARVLPDLTGLNDSAALFRRELFARFGGWDAVRIGADKELIWRFERLAGRPPEAFRRRTILPGCPLAFGRLAPSSLTRDAATHVLTIYHGLRREYREAAAFWHDGLDAARIRRAGLGAEPPFFPAPPVLRPERKTERKTERETEPGGPDLLFIGDFNFRGGTQHSALAMIRAARAAGLSAALLHYRRYDQDVTAPLSPRIRRLARDEDLRIVAPGEALRAGTVIVTYPAILQERMDRFPEVAHDRLVVVVNQLAERDRAGTDIAYDPARVRAHLREFFGHEGIWAPISERVRAIMAADPRYPAPWPDTWTPLVGPTQVPAGHGESGPVIGRPHDERPVIGRPHDERPVIGRPDTRPVIGRHGRDDPLKWPRDPEALRAAYCAGRPCTVRFLGGAAAARARLKRWPGNWRAIAFGDADVAEFLAGLDVFVHHPDPEYVEEFGRAVLEAMAAGVPVILAPELAPTFGAAALYGPPDGVWPLVARLHADPAFRAARIEAGHAFAATCSPAAFPARLARLPAPPAGTLEAPAPPPQPPGKDAAGRSQEEP